MKDSKKIIPPVFIHFERYDSKTSFGFDDFEDKLSSCSISAKIFHVQSDLNLILEKSAIALLNIRESTIGIIYDESVQFLSELKTRFPGIDIEYHSAISAAANNITSSVTILGVSPDSGRIRFLGSLIGRKREMLFGILLAAAEHESILSREAIEWASAVRDEVRLKVFVSHMCPSCPPAAIVCGALSIVSPKIFTEIIDVKEYRSLSDKYGVIGLPRVVVNDSISFAADIGPKKLIKEIQKICG